MNCRAVIFDIYQTLLDVGPPPADAETRWAALWHDLLGREPRLDLAGFAGGCREAIARDHAAAKAAGVPFPEVYWPEIVREVVPEVAALDATSQAEFAYRQTGLWHTVRLNPAAADTLRDLQQRGLLLGIASNAQPYTLRELDEALATAGLSATMFTPALTFWSFAHGFSKPDPHVFRLLTARLRALGVAPAETLMVGDRLDNDIEPARDQGWQTWQITPRTTDSWGRLRMQLR
ncbi:MAG: HAD family hydrolase [Lacunisphaera sp.]|nr:HAD family hydrolase [Lacunisphaera sp.]